MEVSRSGEAHAARRPCGPPRTGGCPAPREERPVPMHDNPTDPRIRNTKSLLRQAYASLLAETPQRHPTVAELCARAGVHRSTFYAHYQDIFDLQTRLEEEIYEEFVDTLSRADLAAIAGTDQVRRFLTTLFEFVARNADLCVVFLRDRQDRSFLMRLLMCARDMTLEQFSKVYKKASVTQLEMYYAFIASGCIGLLEYWIKSGLALPVAELARVTDQMIARGVAFLENPEAS